MGQLRQMGKQFYDTDIHVEVLSEQLVGDYSHVTMRMLCSCSVTSLTLALGRQHTILERYLRLPKRLSAPLTKESPIAIALPFLFLPI
eukprot:g34742.t1